MSEIESLRQEVADLRRMIMDLQSRPYPMAYPLPPATPTWPSPPPFKLPEIWCKSGGTAGVQGHFKNG